MATKSAQSRSRILLIAPDAWRGASEYCSRSELQNTSSCYSQREFLLTNHAYAFTPAWRRSVIMGHQFVKADWNRFKPTKAVNRNQ
jgi:hypothetical protein